MSQNFNFSIFTKLSNNDTYYNFSPMTNTLKKMKSKNYKIEWTWKEIFDFGQETQKYLMDGKHDGLILLVSCNACPNDTTNNNNNDNINSRDNYNNIDFGVLDSKSKVIYFDNFLRQFSPQTDLPGIFIMDLKLSKENSGIAIEENCIGSMSVMNDNYKGNRCILTHFLKDTDEKKDLMRKVNKVLKKAWNSNESSLEWINVAAFFDIDFHKRLVFELECMVITNLSQDTTIYVAVKNWNVIGKKMMMMMKKMMKNKIL